MANLLGDVAKTSGGGDQKIGGNVSTPLQNLGLDPIKGVNGGVANDATEVAGKAVTTHFVGGEFGSLKELSVCQTEISSGNNQNFGVHPTFLRNALRSPITSALKPN